jgi:hypothetical protein
VLANLVPAVVCPAIRTEYVVGAATLTADGTVKLTRRVEPVTTVTAVDVAVAAGPPAAGVNVTVTPVAAMVPAGKPDPVRFTTWIPACAKVGDGVGVNVTAVCAATNLKDATSAAKTAAATARRLRKAFVIIEALTRFPSEEEDHP